MDISGNNIELYIIGFTLLGIAFLWLYTLPLRLIAKSYKGMKNIINNKSKWNLF